MGCLSDTDCDGNARCESKIQKTHYWLAIMILGLPVNKLETITYHFNLEWDWYYPNWLPHIDFLTIASLFYLITLVYIKASFIIIKREKYEIVPIFSVSKNSIIINFNIDI